MLKKRNKIAIWGLSGVMMTQLLGCGQTASRPAATTRPIRAKITQPVTTNDSIADRSRRQVLKRKGSWGLSSQQVEEVAPLVASAAAANQLPQDLIFGIIWVESRFDPRAVSPVGARGLMQLMPKTADYLAECIKWSDRVDSFDPRFNVTAGSYYIARLIRSFDGDEDLALAAYNAGPTRVRRWLKNDGTLPPVSVEYASMVQTARSFFNGNRSTFDETPVVTDAELDRLGLTILIAGLSNRFAEQRQDDANPFE